MTSMERFRTRESSPTWVETGPDTPYEFGNRPIRHEPKLWQRCAIGHHSDYPTVAVVPAACQDTPRPKTFIGIVPLPGREGCLRSTPCLVVNGDLLLQRNDQRGITCQLRLTAPFPFVD
jgi:hypothetical protein